MLSPSKSFFSKILLTLLPFIVAVAALYSMLLSTSIIVTEDHVVSEYLLRELDQFKSRYRELGKDVSPPVTSYMRGYWHEDNSLPEQYKTLGLGIHEFSESVHVVVTEIDGRLFYLALDEWHLTSIEKHELILHSIILVVAGLVVIAGGMVAVFIARRLSDPVTELAEDVASGWQAGKQFRGSDRMDEVGLLSRTLNSLVHQLHQNTEREKSFTRHASHEMRTPTAIIRNALAVIKLPDCSEEKKARNLDRVNQACSDIENMIDVFLCLGREERDLPTANINPSDLIDALILKHKTLIDRQGLIVTAYKECDQGIDCISALLEIAVGNLLRNACTYSEQNIVITITDQYLKITNDYALNKSTENSYGYGLEIVRRICDYSHWLLEVDDKGDDFTAVITFRDIN